MLIQLLKNFKSKNYIQIIQTKGGYYMSYDLVQRVACYVRVSTQEQKLRGLSPEAQRSTLREYSEKHNLKIVEWYEDLGVSGRKPIKKRPELQRMIEDAEAGNFDRIIFIKLDRYFRSVAEYYECQKRLDAKNVKWTATEEKYDLLTASGRYWVTQKLAMAEYEADQTGERIDLVNEYKVKTGQPLTGSHNLGLAYTVEKDEDGLKRVVKDPNTKDLVMDYINHFLTHNNKKQAYLYVNDKYNTSYAYGVLDRVLTDTKIYGHYRGNDKYCEPYVDKDTWDTIQQLLNNNIKVTPSKRVYLFTGLLICPVCGRKMAGTYVDRQSRKGLKGQVYLYHKVYYSYRCNHSNLSSTCSYHKRPNESKLEKILLDDFDKYVTTYIDSVSVVDAQIKNDKCVKDKIAQIKGEMTRLNNMYQKNRISEEKYDKEYDELETRLKDLESQLEPFVERDLSKYEDLLKSDWKELYNALTKENKRTFWRKYIKQIILNDNGTIDRVIFF
jgi:DNA invertase Pin-like site-specific DNA recombinase